LRNSKVTYLNSMIISIIMLVLLLLLFLVFHWLVFHRSFQVRPGPP